MKHHAPPVRIVVGLAIAIALDTACQLLWKYAVIDLPDAADYGRMAQDALRQPLFVLVVAIMGIQLLNWMLVLARCDLSFAHAITALSYVTVAATSVLWLGEWVDPYQAAGILLIFVGVWLVSRTTHHTERPSGETQ